MKDTVNKIETLLAQAHGHFTSHDETHLQTPIAAGKWSRKQILGHLIDSALNNWQRFTEIGNKPQPYIYREYHQSELVKINDYQNKDTTELLRLWVLMNRQIIRVIENQTEETLNLKVQFTDGTMQDLRFIMTDYPEHMAHHVKQIVSA
ncbi:DinB family protein [Flavobacterium caeni]|uniref:DinB superfamily protein n=1 Tax=Flavobacterium caeni TaxID=490189 RepID=A0A1G5D5L7_9FLAO|nr:DinB family protein [Flavobacterium caeni]SCY09954.1 DinB superfamily protein [Flavobacterium caeni]